VSIVYETVQAANLTAEGSCKQIPLECNTSLILFSSFRKITAIRSEDNNGNQVLFLWRTIVVFNNNMQDCYHCTH
jgi:hypothetical protein